jgi:4-diphosphocytidyl-2-C-methyl-D-erythritol kinase
LIPEERVLTAEAYGMLRRFSPPLGVERFRSMIAGGLLDHAKELLNDFEEAIFAKFPQLLELKTRLCERGAAWAGLSGSGSAIVGAFRTPPERDAAKQRFSGVRVEACETI